MVDQDEPRNEKITISVTATEKEKIERLANWRDRKNPVVGPMLRTKSLDELVAEHDQIMGDARESLQSAGAGS